MTFDDRFEELEALRSGFEPGLETVLGDDWALFDVPELAELLSGRTATSQWPTHVTLHVPGRTENSATLLGSLPVSDSISHAQDPL